MSELLKNATPVENQVPANGQPVAVELTDGTKISAERAVEWFDVALQEFRYQVEVEGKQYLGKKTENGQVELF